MDRKTQRTQDARRDGARGEDIALAWFQTQGYLLIARNLRLRWAGELDLILHRDSTLHVVEVKTVGPFSRSRVHDPLLYYGLPQLARLRRTLGLWLQDSRSRSMAPHWTDLSVDLCTVDQRQAPPLIRHVRSILPPEDF
ncbi:MAG: YraN family protein [Calditrichaeota bacterium]|nr:YraN family protein [Candidatus Cloacimonadota bacterium]MCB1045562.1 YraN family protein [Calditrichota bacterium]MCB9473293.1 YraN family protein [Candidatus Delongbacteria bacterium]